MGSNVARASSGGLSWKPRRVHVVRRSRGVVKLEVVAEAGAPTTLDQNTQDCVTLALLRPQLLDSLRSPGTTGVSVRHVNGMKVAAPRRRAGGPSPPAAVHSIAAPVHTSE